MNTKPVINESELSKVENPLLNAGQLNLLLSKTPQSHIYERAAKGGGKWKYVTGVYVKKVLNLMFGWNWDFEIVAHETSLELKQVIVKGKLTVRTGGQEIVRMQFGRQDIKFKKQADEDGQRRPLDLGNDLKGATTDALKKCASELGIAADIYGPNEFREIEVIEDAEPRELNELTKLVQNAANIDELQMLWASFSADEQKTAKDAVNLKKAEL